MIDFDTIFNILKMILKDVFSETAFFKWNSIQSWFRLEAFISILAITKDGPPGSELSKAFFREEYQLNYEIGILRIFILLYMLYLYMVKDNVNCRFKLMQFSKENKLINICIAWSSYQWVCIADDFFIQYLAKFFF